MHKTDVDTYVKFSSKLKTKPNENNSDKNQKSSKNPSTVNGSQLIRIFIQIKESIMETFRKNNLKYHILGHNGKEYQPQIDAIFVNSNEKPVEEVARAIKEKGYNNLVVYLMSLDIDCCKILFENGFSSPKIIDKYGYTAIHRAVFYSNKEIVNYLLSKKIDINIQTLKAGKLDLTLAHIAVYGFDDRMLNLLIEAGIDLNIKDFNKETPLNLAERMSKDYGMGYIIDILKTSAS